MATLRYMVAAVFVVVLGGCSSDDGETRQQETLDTMNAEMPLEERVALCDGYGFDSDSTYHVWRVRWERFLELEVPDRETFDDWIKQDVCIDSEFMGGDEGE